MRSRIVLCLWLLGILFPLAWLGNFSSTYRQVFDAVFGPEWVHIFMHTVLYAGLCILAVIALRLPTGFRTFPIALCLVMVIGIVQEGLQLAGQGIRYWSYSPVLARAAFDLGIDLAGGLLGLLLIFILQRMRSAHPAFSADPQAPGRLFRR